MSSLEYAAATIDSVMSKSRPLLRCLNWVGWIAAVALCLHSALRLFHLIDHYAVNLLFYDNFVYYFSLAHRWNYWQRFTAPVGPHREGLGLLLSSVIAPISHWNMRAEAFAIGVILLCAMLAGLWMKKRAFGFVAWYDLIIFSCFFLTPKQWEIWSNTINSSHGVLPLLLIMLWCLSWTIQRKSFRDGSILSVNFLAIFTGFGIFLGLLTSLAFAFRRNKLGLRVSLASLLMFFWRYKFEPANPGFRFLDPAILRLPYAIAVGLSHACNIVVSPWDQIVGYALLALLIAIAVFQFRGFRSGEPRSLIIFSLIGFTFLFSVSATVGRISIGDKFLTWSRYVPLLVPGFVGAYLSIGKMRSSPLRCLCTAIAVAIALRMSLVIAAGDRGSMEKYRTIKVNWINTYFSTGSLTKANHAGELGIYPEPLPDDFAAKIDYLRENRLNFFASKDPGEISPATRPTPPAPRP